MGKDFTPHQGGCSCGHVRYEVLSEPLIVHACHCTWCQTQSGGAFAINALIEAERVNLLKGEVETIDTPSPSGAGQVIHRCPKCKIALWSNYCEAIPGDVIRFIRVGTLDNPNLCPPDVHIFTSTKQAWFQLPEGAQAVAETYELAKTWRPESIERLQVIREKLG